MRRQCRLDLDGIDVGIRRWIHVFLRSTMSAPEPRRAAANGARRAVPRNKGEPGGGHTTRERIVAVAAAPVEERGFQATKLSDIAAEAGFGALAPASFEVGALLDEVIRAPMPRSARA